MNSEGKTDSINMLAYGIRKKNPTDITWKPRMAWRMHEQRVKICQRRQVQLSRNTRGPKK